MPKKGERKLTGLQPDEKRLWTLAYNGAIARGLDHQPAMDEAWLKVEELRSKATTPKS